MPKPRAASTIFSTKARNSPAGIGVREGLLRARPGVNCSAMDVSTTRRLPARPYALPNLLTYARIVAVPVVCACLYWQSILNGGLWLRWVALVLFVAAAVTDILDGYFARSW